jgi:hypothetical protein
MDSSTLLLRLLADGYEVTALSFDYGQKHKVELERAKALVQYLNSQVPHFGYPVIRYQVIRLEGLAELLNSTLAWVLSLGGAGIGGLMLIFSKILPSRTFTTSITDKIFNLEDTLKGEVAKVVELEHAQTEYQQANDDLLIELAKLSPNAKAKELAIKLEEKKKALNVQQIIQDKVAEKTKEFKAKIVSVLKKTENVVSDITKE